MIPRGVMYCSLWLAWIVSKGTSFSVVSPLLRWRSRSGRLYSAAERQSSATQPTEDFAFPNAELVDLFLLPHKPLGCTVEESLAGGKHVFVSSVTPGSYADEAGLLPGDVIVGMTGIFGEVTSVIGQGIEQVKGLVASRPDEEPLELQIARGTNVLEDHEHVLVELCSDPGASDQEVENCVLDFLQGGYATDAVTGTEQNLKESECDDDDSECLVNDMYNLWAEELPPPTTLSMSELSSEPKAEPKAKPWSSRSSPSGTWIRDPETGEMRNIDT